VPDDDLRIFWGETHNNTHQFDSMPVPFDALLERAATHLDFIATAYYTACAAAFRPGGHPAESGQPMPVILEGWKPQERLDREWAEVQHATRRHNTPGRFVTFPGYEWQGDGSSGDHNVYARREGLPIFRVNTVAELYARLRDHDAIAIPHHTAYRPGVRGRDWAVLDEAISPFCEIYSVHGCSETDEEWIGLRQNSHMGPGIGPGCYQAALDRGLHLGAIASTDGWDDMPGRYGHGLMACLATELTREALWAAFRARRVYGATGDRIALDFRVGDARMGQAVAASGPRRIRVRAVGLDAIDRIELLRNGRVIATVSGPRRIYVKAVGLDAIDRIELLRNGRVLATHCHQGTWDAPRPGSRARFKLRIEAGWGPRPNELPPMERQWQGALRVAGGRVLGFQPCWISPGQGTPAIEGDSAEFTMRSSTRHAAARWQNANVFELEADPTAEVEVRMNGLAERAALGDLARCSREMWFRDECVGLLAERAGVEPFSPERMDPYHHYAFKVKLHRAIPEAGYTAEWEVVDDEPLAGEANYRVRVEQRNAQRAWSSPIWVRPA